MKTNEGTLSMNYMMEPTDVCLATSSSDVHNQVKTYFIEYFMPYEELEHDALLIDDLGADSLDLLQVAHDLNDMFDIDIQVNDLPHFLSVGSACDHVVHLIHQNQ
ncbi:acyl carrier protein [Glaciimonas immobilis]|uniref:Acyl carrier protein n=1 Tax=Glaciimonas immobilis TaxID=728004 RepID=A0A840RP98_9BURK|nr:acyl carrier protein [Glaciimonas immobilis]KAF3999344.1 acyl carrier protein [Glaciimonas immobilis]MBB5198826.1 acyl carrier protein [Glaciimonas immobilis]